MFGEHPTVRMATESAGCGFTGTSGCIFDGTMKHTNLCKTLVLLVVVSATASANDLPIPPLLDPIYGSDGVARYEIRAQSGRREFLEGYVTETLGYSGDYLGPTVRLRRGDDVLIEVENGIDEVTTVHWHGLHVPAESDGGPHQTIQPGETWRAEFPVMQQAATLWYHPHPVGRTGIQVYAGLAGFLIIDDDHSDGLQLPRTYGVDDIPLILQDKRFDSEGQFAYAASMPEAMHGFAGEALLANGVADARFVAPASLVRFRVLNGSDINVFRLRMNGNVGIRQIASDGGYLEHPLDIDFAVISTGERIELIADFSDLEDGETVDLLVDDMYGQSFTALSIRVDSARNRLIDGESRVPARLNTIIRPDVPEDVKVRQFVMRSMGPGGQLTINGRSMDMDRIDVRVPIGTTEVWEVTNPRRGMPAFPHVFHLHEGQYLLLEVNGEEPPPGYRGWKDTWLLWPGDEIKIVASFEDYAGVYMYHCHFLIHEDLGMMGQFEVFEP